MTRALRVPVGAPPLPRPVVRAVVRHGLRHALDPRLPFAVQRRALDTVARTLPLPPGVQVRPDRLGGVAVERVSAGPAPRGTVLFLHGGGYCVGSPAQARPWAGHLARHTGVEVVLVDYRLAPEHPFPAALDDTLRAWEALGDRSGPGDRPALAGDSAGAGLALTATVRRRAAGLAPPAALVLLSPWLDLAADRAADPALVARDPLLRPGWLRRCATAYAGGRDPAHPDLSPLHHDLRGLPPTLVQAGADDLLAPDLDRFASRLAAAGVDARVDRRPLLWHDFPLHVGLLAAADDCLLDVAELLRDTEVATR